MKQLRWFPFWEQESIIDANIYQHFQLNINDFWGTIEKDMPFP